MRRIWAVTTILFLSMAVINGQEKQYVVKITGDTLYGKLMINPVRDNSTSIIFKGDDGSRDRLKPLRYTYIYYNPKYQFRSVPYRNQRLFMQIVWEKENISLYNYVHQRDNSVVTSRLAIKPDGKAVELSVLTFKAQMSEFLEDCPLVVAKIQDKVYRFKNHQEMFLEYDQCMSGTQPSATVASNQTPSPSQSTNNSQATTPVTPPNPTTPAPPANPVKQPQEQASNISQEVVAEATAVEKPLTEIQVLRLKKIHEFKSYVQELDEFSSRSELVELLFDVENRIRDQRGIPDYIWRSLESMVQSNPELSAKAQNLRLNIQ